jgi:hypothetical protein
MLASFLCLIIKLIWGTITMLAVSFSIISLVVHGWSIDAITGFATVVLLIAAERYLSTLFGVAPLFVVPATIATMVERIKRFILVARVRVCCGEDISCQQILLHQANKTYPSGSVFITNGSLWDCYELQRNIECPDWEIIIVPTALDTSGFRIRSWWGSVWKRLKSESDTIPQLVVI